MCELFIIYDSVSKIILFLLNFLLSAYSSVKLLIPKLLLTSSIYQSTSLVLANLVFGYSKYLIIRENIDLRCPTYSHTYKHIQLILIRLPKMTYLRTHTLVWNNKRKLTPGFWVNDGKCIPEMRKIVQHKQENKDSINPRGLLSILTIALLEKQLLDFPFLNLESIYWPVWTVNRLLTDLA